MGGALSAFVEFGDHRHFGVAHRDGAGGGDARAVLVPAGEGRVRVRRGDELGRSGESTALLDRFSGLGRMSGRSCARPTGLNFKS